MTTLKIYIASKVRHAELLRGLRTGIDSDGIHFNARWVETCGLAFNATKPVSHWQQENFDDIEAADAVFGYAEEGEHLKGGLVEIGWALRAGKPIFIIGQTITPTGDSTKTAYHPDFDPWSRFDNFKIRRAPDFQTGVKMVRQLFKSPEHITPML